MLQQLSYDILVGHVFPNLNGNDILAVSMSCKKLNAAVTQLVWRLQYRATFDRGSNLDLLEGDWETRYSQRMNSSIYLWGKTISGQRNYPHQLPHRHVSGISTPWKYPSQVKKARQISFTGYGLLILDLNGAAWVIGTTGPAGSNYSQTAPRCLTENLGVPFDFISAGRTFFVGISRGSLYAFTTNQVVLAAAAAPDVTKVTVADSITTVSAGWDTTAAISQTVGILVWRDISQRPSDYQVVPETAGIAGSIAVGAGFILFLDEASRLLLIEISADDTNHFNTRQIMEDEYPVMIRAMYNRFAVICRNKNAYLGRFVDGKLEIEPIDGADKLDLCDIALGDHHNLALSRNGHVYAWGCESKECGSFGLGVRDEVLSRGATASNSFIKPDLLLENPTKLGLESVLSISAGGWQSAAIIADTN